MSRFGVHPDREADQARSSGAMRNSRRLVPTDGELDDRFGVVPIGRRLGHRPLAPRAVDDPVPDDQTEQLRSRGHRPPVGPMG